MALRAAKPRWQPQMEKALGVPGKRYGSGRNSRIIFGTPLGCSHLVETRSVDRSVLMHFLFKIIRFGSSCEF